MKVYDLLRAVIAAFAAHLAADPANADAVKVANAKSADLQAQLDATNAKLASDEGALADLGTPLSAEENDHLTALLGGALATPSVALPPTPAPPVEQVADTLPGGDGQDSLPAGDAVPAAAAAAAPAADAAPAPAAAS